MAAPRRGDGAVLGYSRRTSSRPERCSATAPAAGGLFPPQDRSLGLDHQDLSPRLLRKLVYAGSNATSFAAGSDFLAELADRHLDPKALERACGRIGAERLRQRQDLLEAWQDLPLARRDGAPDGVDVPEVVAVLMDGGRLQIRPPQGEEATGPDPQPEPPQPEVPVPAAQAGTAQAADQADEASRPRHWREDKVGVLATLDSAAHPADPSPELPEVFRDPLVVLKLAREVGHLDGVPPAGAFHQTPAGAAPESSADEEPPAQAAGRAPRPGRPEVLSKRVVASRQDSTHFGPLLAAVAWSLGLFAAARRAFVADGAACNWTVQKTYFARWTPVLDFIHALSYVFAAALAGRPVREGWEVYQRWISWVWQGQIGELLAALRVRLAELGGVAGGPAQAVATCLGYVEEHQGRMNYADYRRQGLPIMSSLVESVVKQVGRRVKGTEKFWSEEGAEALLQLRADYLSDDEPLATFWQQRADRMTGQRPRHQRVA
jgi:hypothetical protein